VPLLLLLLCALPLQRAAGQGVVRGTLYDSLRAGGPVAGAEVVILGTGRKATTDERGRFDIPDVPAGRQVVAFWAPWLDSLALPPMRQEIDVAADGRSAIVFLGTPSPRSYQLAACGVELDGDQGVLVGEIRGPDGAPRGGIGVATRWTEMALGVGLFERRIVAAVDTSNAAGLYSICGVPVGSEVALRAIGPERTGSNEIVLAITGRVQRRDLTIAPPDLRATIRGRVVGPDGSALREATVAVTGDSGLIAQADGEGHFVLEGVPRRSTQLVVRALGHVPTFATLELLDPAVDIDAVRLDRLPQELATVTVSGEPLTAGRAQFETRRARGLGTFIDDATLSRMPGRSANAVATLAPRTAVQQTRRGPMIYMRRGSEFCRPRFFVDGYDNGDLSAEEENNLLRIAKRIEVYDANSAPAGFNDFDGCGAIVIWTR
jgi:hypothetical protein